MKGTLTTNLTGTAASGGAWWLPISFRCGLLQIASDANMSVMASGIIHSFDHMQPPALLAAASQTLGRKLNHFPRLSGPVPAFMPTVPKTPSKFNLSFGRNANEVTLSARSDSDSGPACAANFSTMGLSLPPFASRTNSPSHQPSPR
jgi:hypothetical protein